MYHILHMLLKCWCLHSCIPCWIIIFRNCCNFWQSCLDLHLQKLLHMAMMRMRLVHFKDLNLLLHFKSEWLNWNFHFSVSRGKGSESFRMPLHSWLTKWSMWISIFRGIPLLPQEYGWGKGSFDLTHLIVSTLCWCWICYMQIIIPVYLFHIFTPYTLWHKT